MFPDKVKILGHEYKILPEENYVVQSGGETGEVNNYLNVIRIGKELTPSGQMEILLHEILEAINYRLELNLDHPKLCILSEVLHQVLRDNRLSFYGR